MGNLKAVARTLLGEDQSRDDRTSVDESDICLRLSSVPHENIDRFVDAAIALSGSTARSFCVVVTLDDEEQRNRFEQIPQLAHSDEYVVWVRPTEAAALSGALRMLLGAP